MKKENCRFCGHRWTRSSAESPITCPNCRRKYVSVEKLEEIIVDFLSKDNIDIESELSKYIPPKISEQDIKEIFVKIINDELPKNVSVEKRERFMI